MRTSKFLRAEQKSAVITDAQSRCREWMFDQSFPFWFRHSASPSNGFFERLDLRGEGNLSRPSRVRVQARQTYSFALASILGWQIENANAVSDFGVINLIKTCRRGDGFYGKLVELGLGLLDDQVELYDNAFVLLAFATAYKANANPLALAAGRELFCQLVEVLPQALDQGGYKERLPAPVRREQNPHMHFCEALLAWYEATGDDIALQRAEEIADWVMRSFFDRSFGVLLEFDQSTPQNHCEVGHLYEWVWLLDRLDRLKGHSLRVFAFELYDGARWLSDEYEFYPLSQSRNGSPKSSHQRVWIRTEALKAHIAMHRAARSKTSADLIHEEVEHIFRYHLTNGAPDGAWIDTVTHEGQAVSTDITAASGYHIYLAFSELLEI